MLIYSGSGIARCTVILAKSTDTISLRVVYNTLTKSPYNFAFATLDDAAVSNGHFSMSDKTVLRSRIGGQPRLLPEKEACLIMIEGDFLGEVYVLSKQVTVIGRTDDVDIMLPDVDVSRHHAMLSRQSREYSISDLGSTNGTRVNTEPLTESTILQDGDKIHISGTTLKFTFQDADDTEYLRQLRLLAIKDGLTRIYNRRYFMETIKKEFSYSARTHSELGLIIFDIDHFKICNDQYGHPAGDFILKNIAALVETEARNYDIFARYGGEEFVFLLRDADQHAAIALAERIREMVASHTFKYDGNNLQISISLGVATYDGISSMNDDQELISTADRYLYMAKNAGRNRTCYDTKYQDNS